MTVETFPGDTLDNESLQRLKRGLKGYYMVLKIVGTVLFTMLFIGTVGFLWSFFTDPAYQEGTFEIPVVRSILLIITLAILLPLLFGAYKLRGVSGKKLAMVENGQFTWRYGKLSLVRRVHTGTKDRRILIYVDGEECILLGSDYWSMMTTELGTPMLVVYLDNIAFTLLLIPEGTV